MKQAIGRAMKLGAKGIKIRVSGRLGGAEIGKRRKDITREQFRFRQTVQILITEQRRLTQPTVYRRKGMDLQG
jgi:hypothetical protein